MVRTKEFRVPTSRRVEFIDITPLLEMAVGESGIQRGLAHIILRHTSAALTLQEFEPGLLEDFKNFLGKFASDDPEVPEFLHNRTWLRPVPPDEPKNADAHIKSLFMGNSRVVPVEDSRPVLGTWQRLILVEMDGPREREVTIMTQGDTALEGFRGYWAEKAEIINAAMEPYLEKQWMGEVLQASKYIMRGGKRIRGVLTVLICEALGGDMDKALDAAVAVEMVHCSTLVKDDFQDGDARRRGDLAAWAVWGIRRATALVDVTIPHALSIVRKYGVEAVNATVDAWKEVGTGQVKDLFLSTFKGKRVYEEIVKSKTGALFGLAATLGAIAAKATKKEKRLAANYGRSLGYLFQVIDDVSEKEAGKPVSGSFHEWLKGISAQEKVRCLMEEVRELAGGFPDTPYRSYLAELPRFAVESMLTEAKKEIT